MIYIFGHTAQHYGRYWSMWAWLSTTIPNRHTLSLLHFQRTSRYSEYHGSDVSCVLTFALTLSSFGTSFRELCSAWGPSRVGGLGPRSHLLAVLVHFKICELNFKQVHDESELSQHCR